MWVANKHISLETLGFHLREGGGWVTEPRKSVAEVWAPSQTLTAPSLVSTPRRLIRQSTNKTINYSS